MDEPETWRWIWLAAGATFAIGELLTTGFLLLPFGLGAAVATVLAFLDVSVAVQWGAFVVVSGASLVALRPIAHRLDVALPAEGIGSRRLIGEEGIVIEDIPAVAGSAGQVKVHREEWFADSDTGAPIAQGTAVRITDVRGTRLLVRPVDAHPGSTS